MLHRQPGHLLTSQPAAQHNAQDSPVAQALECGYVGRANYGARLLPGQPVAQFLALALYVGDVSNRLRRGFALGLYTQLVAHNRVDFLRKLTYHLSKPEKSDVELLKFT